MTLNTMQLIIMNILKGASRSHPLTRLEIASEIFVTKRVVSDATIEINRNGGGVMNRCFSPGNQMKGYWIE